MTFVSGPKGNDDRDAASRTASASALVITEPGQTDWLMIFTGIFLLCFAALVGVLMMRLLYLPLTMVPQEQKAPYEVVGTLCPLAMFAPGNFLWIAALLVAMMDIPDPTTVFSRM